MKKNTFTLRGALTCAALSIALVAGLVPAQALSSIAFAAEGGEDVPAAVEVQPEAEATDQAEQASSATSQAAEADRVNEVVPVAAQQGSDAAADEQPAETATTPSSAEIDMLTTSVALSGSGTVLTSNGLTYQVNEDGQSVAVLGWATPAPEGALSIPEQIVVGTVAYRVTGVKAADPAGSASAEPADVGDVDPYMVDFYAEADKAPGVTSIHLPASIETIDVAFFQQFPNAATVAVVGDNPHFDSHNGMLFTEELTDLLLVPEGMEGAAVLPASVATVPACVITRCTKLQVMDIPTGSTAKAHFASENGILYTADKATLLAAPAGIGASVRIAPECTSIATGAFWGNEGLKTIIASDKISDIAAADATSAAVPAFNDDTIATATILTADRAAWEAVGFANFADPAEPGQTIAPSEQAGVAYLLQDDGTLAAYWEGEGDAPESLTIPASIELDGIAYRVASIADGGFADQEGLTAIGLPEGLATIGERAFAGSGLASASIPGSVVSVGASAFESCGSLTSVSLNEGTHIIGASAFAGTAIEQIVLPASVASIGQNALAGCENLTCVLALGDVQDVDATALAEDSGVSVYVPLREDGAYAWSLGAPAANNHLMPYGVKASAEPIALAEGESADLFEGGYLEAPGEVKATSAYKSNVSVTDNRTVTAKQLGTTPVTTTLSLGDTQLASTTQTARVMLAAEEGEAANEPRINPEIESTSTAKPEKAADDFVPSVISPENIVESDEYGVANISIESAYDNTLPAIASVGSVASITSMLRSACANLGMPASSVSKNDVVAYASYYTILLDLNALPGDVVDLGCDVDALRYYPASSTWKVVRSGIEGDPYYYGGKYYLARSDYGSVPTSSQGLEFRGFTTNQIGGGHRYVGHDAAIDTSWVPTANQILYAEWNGDDATRIYFDYQDGSGIIGDDICTYGICPDGHKVPVRNGYTFVGYFTQKTGGIQYYEPASDDDEWAEPIRRWDLPSGTTLYGQWISTTAQYGGISTSGELEFLDTNLNSFVFGIDDDGGFTWMEVRWEGGADINTLDPDQMITLKAVPGYGYYGDETHRFMTSSGIDVPCVEFVTLSIPRSDFSSVSFNATTKEFHGTITGAIVPATYSVTLHTNGGTIKSGNITSYKTGQVTVLPQDVQRDGYTFGGWYGSSSCTGSPNVSISGTSGGDRNFYAKWTPIRYLITLDPKGGTLSGYGNKDSNGCYKFTYDIEYGDSTEGSFHAPIPTHENAKNSFVGWRGSWVDQEGATDIWTSDGKVHENWYASYGSYGNYKLTAVWRTEIELNNGSPAGVTSVTENSNIYYYNSIGASVSDSHITDLGGGYHVELLDANKLNSRVATSFAKTEGDKLLNALPMTAPEGYAFNGYVKTGSKDIRIDKSGKIHRYALHYPPNGTQAAAETTWDAQWTLKQFSISYASGGELTSTDFDFNTEIALNLAGGFIDDPINGSYWVNNKRRVPAYNTGLPVVSRAGFAFAGWTLNNTTFTANWTTVEALTAGDTFVKNYLRYRVLKVNNDEKTATVSVERAYRPTYYGESLIGEPSGVLDFTVPVVEKGYSCSVTALQYNQDEDTYGSRGALAGCQNVSAVILSSQMTEITASAFENCKGLTSISIPASVQNIREKAFEDCDALASVEFKGNLTSIDDAAFAYCDNLEEVIFPNSIETIGERAFTGCPIYGLRLYTVKTIEWLAFGRNNDAPANTVIRGDVVIDKVDTIDAEAFSHSQIDRFEVKGDIASIEYCAFDSSTVRQLVFGGSIGTIHSDAFHDAQSISSIFFLGDVGTIGAKAFAGNPIEELTFGGGVGTIGDRAFEKYTSTGTWGLSLHFGGDVGVIGDYAFADNDLSEQGGLYFPGSVEAIGAHAFADVDIYGPLEFGGAVNAIGSCAFVRSGITSLIFSNGSEQLTIGGEAFKENNFTSLTLPSQTTSIGWGAFVQCKNLSTVTSLGTITKLPENIFYACSSLRSVALPNSLKSIGANAFRKCSYLFSITLPSSVVEVGQYAFACNSTTSMGGVSIYVNSTIESGKVGNLSGYTDGGPYWPCTTVYANTPGVKVEAWQQAGYTIASRTLTFNMNGHGTPIDVKTLWYNYQASTVKPADPVDSGGEYAFKGWYTDESFTTPFDWNSYVTTATTLYAKWGSNMADVYITHYLQEPDGSYTAYFNDFIEAQIGETYSAPLHEYAGYRLNPNHPDYKASGIVPGGDAILELEIYYDFIPYSITYEFAGTVPSGAILPVDSTEGYCTQQVVALKFPDPVDGWNFEGWTLKSGNAFFAGDSLEMGTSDVCLTGTWKALPSTIKFVGNGGSPVPQLREGKTDQTISDRRLPVIAKDGSNFVGWYDNEDFSGDALQQLPEKFPAGGVTYYAKWEIKSYEITWHINGGAWKDGTEGDKSSTVEFGKPTNAITAVVLAPENQAFVGWGTSSDAKEVMSFPVINAGEPKHTEYWAVYGDQMVDYTVECFETDAEIIGEAQTYSGKAGSMIVVKAPEIIGFTVDGVNEQTITLSVDTPNVLRFNYTRNANTVIFDGHGGMGGMAGETVEGFFVHGKALPELPDKAAPMRYGYIFDGWFSTDSGQGTQYYSSKGEADSEYGRWVSENPNAQITLHARWTPEIYEIIYKPGEGSGQEYSRFVRYDGVNQDGTAITLGKPDQNKITAPEDCEFAGWSITYNGVTKLYQASDLATQFAGVMREGIVATAVWARNAHTVTWNAAGGTFASGETQVSAKAAAGSAVADVMPAAEPTKPGALFDGWSLNGAAVSADELAAMKVTGDLTFVAKWDQPSFLVSFKGGVAGAAYQGVYQGGLPSHVNAAAAEEHKTEANYRFYNEELGCVQQWVQYGQTGQNLPVIVDLFKLDGAAPTSKAWKRTGAAEADPTWEGGMTLSGDAVFALLYGDGTPAIFVAEFQPTASMKVPANVVVSVNQTDTGFEVSSSSAAFESTSAGDVVVTGLLEDYGTDDPAAAQAQKQAYIDAAKELLGVDSLMNVALTVANDDSGQAAWGFNLNSRLSNGLVGDEIVVSAGGTRAVKFGLTGLGADVHIENGRDKRDIAKLVYTVQVKQ